MADDKSLPPKRPDELQNFQREAEGGGMPLWLEFGYFLRDNKRWWLTPIVLVLLLLGLLAALLNTGAAPFIYTLF